MSSAVSAASTSARGTGRAAGGGRISAAGRARGIVRGARAEAGGMKVGFLGMGIMGAPMAANLVKAGVDVTVWNRDASKVRARAAASAPPPAPRRPAR